MVFLHWCLDRAYLYKHGMLISCNKFYRRLNRNGKEACIKFPNGKWNFFSFVNSRDFMAFFPKKVNQ